MGVQYNSPHPTVKVKGSSKEGDWDQILTKLGIDTKTVRDGIWTQALPRGLEPWHVMLK